jgi:hypothetical protein
MGYGHCGRGCRLAKYGHGGRRYRFAGYRRSRRSYRLFECSRSRRTTLRFSLQSGGEPRNLVRGDRRRRTEIGAVSQIEQTARRIEHFLAVPAAHQPATQRKLRRLEPKDRFAEGTARRKNHIVPREPERPVGEQ